MFCLLQTAGTRKKNQQQTIKKKKKKKKKNGEACNRPLAGRTECMWDFQFMNAEEKAAEEDCSK